MTSPARPSPAALAAAFALALLGAWIFLQSQDDIAAPVLALAFLLYMHRPVAWKRGALPRLPAWLGPAALFAAGNLADLMLPQALGWVWALGLWARSAVTSSALPVTRSWIAFLFVFPWITHDFPGVGWWFRLSGAAVTGTIFESLGFPVAREGTRLLVGGLPVSVEAACAGMGLLQGLLVAGVVLLLVYFPKGRAFYLLLPAIPALAWAANTARIAGITAVALSEGIEVSQGLFHTWGGLAVIAVMVGLTIPLLSLVRRWCGNKTP